MVVELFSRQTYRSKLINILCVETHHHFIFKCVFNFVFVSFFYSVLKKASWCLWTPLSSLETGLKKPQSAPKF